MSKYPSVYGPEGTFEYEFRNYLGVDRAYCEDIYNLSSYTVRAVWIFEVGETLKFPIVFIVNESSINYNSHLDLSTIKKLYPETYDEIRLYILQKMKSGFIDLET